MKLIQLTASLVGLALASTTTLALGQESTSALSYDPTATAQSLGLEPYAIPADFFPVFPWDHLGSWGDQYQPLKEGIQSTAECACTLSGFVDSEEGIAFAKESGLRCILESHFERFDVRQVSGAELVEKLAAIDAGIKERVESTKDDPFVLGYNLTDEPGAYHFKSLAAAVAAVKKYAPGKLAYINLFPGYASTIGADVDSQLGTYSYEEYLERFVQEVKPQLLSYDNYMIEYSEDMRDWPRASVFFSDLFAVRKVALKYDLPFWFIGSSLCIMEDSSPPTPARYAFQTYVPLAAGAQGLTWFLYYPLGWAESPIDANGKKTLSWQYMRDVNVQAQALGMKLKKYRSTDLGLTQLYTKEDYPNLPQFPAPPTKVLPNVSARFSTSGAFAANEKPRILVGEFAEIGGDSVAAMVVNLNFGSSIKVTFDKPNGFSTLKTISPIDGSETVVSEEKLKSGFWIIPGHGTLFVWEK